MVFSEDDNLDEVPSTLPPDERMAPCQSCKVCNIAQSIPPSSDDEEVPSSVCLQPACSARDSDDKDDSSCMSSARNIVYKNNTIPSSTKGFMNLEDVAFLQHTTINSRMKDRITCISTGMHMLPNRSMKDFL